MTAAALRFVFTFVFGFGLFAACGDERDHPPASPDAGGGGDGGDQKACGAAGETTGIQCTNLGECGAGAQNFVKVQFCDHCFARADTHFCEAGVCRLLEPGTATTIRYVIVVPPTLTEHAQSFTVASVNPIAADGSQVSCASLMRSTCEIDDNGALNARNSAPRMATIGADVYMGEISADAGPGRMVFIQLTSERRGEGALLGWGCATLDVTQDVVNGPIEVPMTAL